MLTIEQQQYRTYILTDPASQSRLEVVPERGGIITRWQVQGNDILYLDRDRFAKPELSVRGGIPILFPICGNLPDNSYTYQGQVYSLKQHGFARDLPWSVVEQSSQDQVQITLTLTSSDQTRAVYPFDFQLEFTYELQGNVLRIQQRYTNQSSQPMPFATGLHPYFRLSDSQAKSQLQFDIPATEFLNQIDRTLHPFAGTFNFDLDEIDVAFQNVSRQSASVSDPSLQQQVAIEYDRLYSTLVFWTVKGKEYYCLEPWSAPRNALNTGEHLLQLQPGASLDLEVKLTVSAL